MNKVCNSHEILEPLPLDRPVVFQAIPQERPPGSAEEAAGIRLLRYQRPKRVAALLRRHTGTHQPLGWPVRLLTLLAGGLGLGLLWRCLAPCLLDFRRTIRLR